MNREKFLKWQKAARQAALEKYSVEAAIKKYQEAMTK